WPPLPQGVAVRGVSETRGARHGRGVTMDQTEAIKSIHQAARRRRRLAKARREATEDLRRFCRVAQAAQVPFSEIAEAAGLSEQRLYGLLDEQPAAPSSPLHIR